MPGKSKSNEPSHVSDDAIQQRAYYLWEADGRPDGTGDYYWHRAMDEAHKAMVEDTATRTAAITRGKNPLEMPPEVKASQKANKAKVKAGENKPVKVKAGKSVEAKKTPKPRGAIQKSH